jgi:phospholipase C
MTSQAASTPGRAMGQRPFPDRPEGSDTLPQIDHILVLMMENHAYDNWLGMLGRGPGQRPRGDGFAIGPDGQPTAANPTPDGKVQHAFRMPTTCQLAGQPTYYDHVPPPAAVAPSNIGPDWPAPAYTGFAQYGFRVPAVVVSPWSRPDHVTSVVHDHTSILAMADSGD